MVAQWLEDLGQNRRRFCRFQWVLAKLAGVVSVLAASCALISVNRDQFPSVLAKPSWGLATEPSVDPPGTCAPT